MTSSFDSSHSRLFTIPPSTSDHPVLQAHPYSFALDPALAPPPPALRPPQHQSPEILRTTANMASGPPPSLMQQNAPSTTQQPATPATISIDRHASAQAKRAASRRSGGGISDQNEDEETQKEYGEMVNGLREDLRKEKSQLSARAYRSRLKLMVSWSKVHSMFLLY